jgi:hypothetical protein
MLVPIPASAITATVDQQQPVIDVSVGGLAIGGFYDQKLAQVVTAGQSGLLSEVRVPVACAPAATLYLEIQAVTADQPNGAVLGSQTYPGTDFPPSFPSSGVTLRPIGLSTPVALSAGQRFAIVLDADGPSPFDGCGIFRGPVGDSYAGGHLYFDSRPNTLGVWVCVCEFVGDRFDLPFATLMTIADSSPPSVAPNLSTAANAAGWHRSDVSVSWSVSDPESGIASTDGCASTTLTDATSGTSLTCTATNGAGLTSSDSLTIRIDRTAPTIAYGSHAEIYEVDATVDITALAGDALSGVASVSGETAIGGPAYALGLGAHTFAATAIDRAGNTATATITITVQVTSGSLCSLTRDFTGDAQVAHSLCAKLDAANDADARGTSAAKAGILEAYRDELAAQAGKALTSEDAQILSDLSRAL